MTPKKLVKPVRKRRTFTDDSHAFELIMQRFDTVDKDNDEIKKQVAAHIEDDSKTHAAITQTLDRHKTYWGLSLKLSGLAVAGWVAWLFK